MLRTSESETEILLGNKQLLGIFFVVAVLLGVAFASGFMVGKGSGGKRPAITGTDVAAAGPPSGGGETHSVPAADTGTPSEAPSGARIDEAAAPTKHVKADTVTAGSDDTPLGSPKRKPREIEPEPAPEVAPLSSPGSFAPKEGQTFLQVAAVGHDEADAVADVLHKKGFRAHAVPKPGNAKIYRVLIGPVRDASDLSNTRDSLRKTGFREVIVQKY